MVDMELSVTFRFNPTSGFWDHGPPLLVFVRSAGRETY